MSRLLFLVLLILPRCDAQRVNNLALLGTARSWDRNVHFIQEHEPGKVNDASAHTYWAVRTEDLPVDIGIEWGARVRIGSIVIRYFDGRMMRSAGAGRTQSPVRLQYWSGGLWTDIQAEGEGQEVSTVRYSFRPITTKRIRLLFTEPPDPEVRHSPDRPGIYVCELEAYDRAHYQVVRSGGELVNIPRKRSYTNDLNEPPSGDAHYEIPGPLIIEPKQTSVYRDILRPNLVPSDNEAARTPVTARIANGTAILFNGFLRLTLNLKPIPRESSLLNRLTGEWTDLPQSQLFRFRTSTVELHPAEFRFIGARTDTAGLSLEFQSTDWQVEVHYALRAMDHFVHKWLTLRNLRSQPGLIWDVTPLAMGLPDNLDLMAGQELTYPVHRSHAGGIFSALESVYWDHVGDALTYYPAVTVAPRADYVSERAAFGVYRNRGETIAGWDRGAREWIIAYHAAISPVPKAWPEVYCEGWTADLSLDRFRKNPAAIEHYFSLAERLGIGYSDTYTAAHDAIREPSEVLRSFVALANRYHVNTGWWADFGADNSWHGTVTPLRPMACKLSPEAEQYFTQLLSSVKTYGLRAMHWADFFTVWPCDRTDHGHAPGKYSIYAQGQRMLRFGRDLRQASPGILLGADGGFTNPQFVKYTDGRGNAWFVDSADRFSAMEPDIHLDRLTASRNQVYAYGAYITNLIPWFRLINWVNHFGYVSHLHDHVGYRYGLLSALAIAGQLTFNDVPDDMPQSDIEFTRHWREWSLENREYLKYGDKLFDRSTRFGDIWQGNADSLAGFSHIRKNRGFIFIVNPTVLDQLAELKLELDAPARTPVIVNEIYPSPRTWGTANGNTVRLHAPAKQVAIFQVGPGTAPSNSPGSPDDSHYLGEWHVDTTGSDRATVSTHFRSPAATYLQATVSEADWAANPWAYQKAYIVLLLKDETVEQNNQLLPDNLPLGVRINGVTKTVHAFQSPRYRIDGSTRAWFVSLDSEVHAGENQFAVELPIRSGLVFQGAYLDTPQ